jgi:hypothetical protein
MATFGGTLLAQKLESMRDEEVAKLISEVPFERISEPSAEFARRLVLINRVRLLQLLKDS